MRFDPMTGEPINEPEETINFDPMTGEPVQKTEEQAMNFDPMTGQPVSVPGKSKGGKWKMALAVAVVGVVAVGSVAFAGVKSGVFLSPDNKVLLATANTFAEETNFSKDLAVVSEILASDKYTVAVKGEAEGAEIDMKYLQASSEKQLSGSIDVEDVEVDFDAVLDKEKLAVQIPAIDNSVFTYYYTKDNDGYLMEDIDAEVIEAFNELLESLHSVKQQENLATDFANVITEEYKNLEFEKVDKEEFEVDGKDRKCKGYETVITSQYFENIISGMEDIVLEEYEDAKDTLKEADLDLEEIFDEMRDEISEMPDVEMTFYLYKNQLACIRTTVDKEDLDILFLGGDSRTQNIEVEVEGKTFLEIKGSEHKGVERTSLCVEDEEVFELEYNYKKGDLTLEGSDMYVKASLDSERNGVTFELEELEIDGDYIPLAGEISVQKGADIEELKGEEFDLGNASESDFEEFEELQEFFQSLEYGEDMYDYDTYDEPVEEEEAEEWDTF